MKKRSSKVQRMAPGLAFVLVITAGGQAVPAQSPYVSLEGREVKALSPEQIAGYETGQGMGFALAAELNGYPGPKHVLELQDELALTDAQLQSTEDTFAQMNSSARDLGLEIVERERELDRLFASHAIDAEGLAAQVTHIAQLQGRLRLAHLQAHLEMMGILSEDQIPRYLELRGYHGGEHQGHHPGEGHEERH